MIAACTLRATFFAETTFPRGSIVTARPPRKLSAATALNNVSAYLHSMRELESGPRATLDTPISTRDSRGASAQRPVF